MLNTATPTPTSAATEPPLPAFTGATYTYDGDGNMVKSVVNGVTTYYAGRHYQEEVDGGDTTTRKYYTTGGQMIAVRTKVNSDPSSLNWIFGDHLGSSSVTANVDGTWNSGIRMDIYKHLDIISEPPFLVLGAVWVQIE